MLMTAVGVVSCTDETFDPVATNGDAISLTSPTSGSFTLTAGNASQNAFTVKWTSSYFGYQAAVRYYLQAVKSSATNFDAAGELTLGDYTVAENTNLEKTVTNRQLNALLLSAGGTIGSAESYKMRVVGKPIGQSSVVSSTYSAVSNVVTITGNPYDTFDEFDRIYVPGNYGGASTYADWAPDNAPKLFSATNNGQYEGFVWMNVGSPEFKFTPGPAWSGDKGDVSEPNSFANLASPGNNIKPTDGAGTYFLSVDWNANTYTVAKRQVAVIGAATPNGWGNPTYLTFDTNPASPYFRMYTADLSLSADEFLIRLKDDWSVKMGTLSGNTENATTGGQYKIRLGGGNMRVPTAGNYKVVLDIRNSANYNLRLMPI